MTVYVRLLPEDIERAVGVGLARMDAAERKRRENHHGAKRESGKDILGALGELGYSIAANRKWEPRLSLDKKTGDFPGIEVRCTDHRNGHLLAHPLDPDDHRLVLVIWDRPWAIVRGWQWAKQAKHSRFWKEPQRGRPCYMVPQDKLRPYPPR